VICVIIITIFHANFVTQNERIKTLPIKTQDVRNVDKF